MIGYICAVFTAEEPDYSWNYSDSYENQSLAIWVYPWEIR